MTAKAKHICTGQLLAKSLKDRSERTTYPNSMSKRSRSQSMDLIATVSLLTSTTCKPCRCMS